MTQAADRPSPDALLREVGRADRGRLKIFLGAAPGVGKTYAMLEAAHARRREGVDVAIGIVETHGRKETQALVAGLDHVPRRAVQYRDRRFEELDLDAVIERKPAIALVDELAHTNIPGSRHLKRYQDVEELLAAGINVYSTLNIQHLESLNDVVARITSVRVHETIPDSVLKQADEIELVDLPPEDLLQRLHEGKVYVPEQARRAINNYFGRGNLTALRELAMRAAAERVDADVQRYMQAHAVQGPWPTNERLMVCVGGDTASRGLIRAAARIAGQRRLPWIAVHVINSRANLLPDAEKDRIAETLRFAEQLGGEAATIPGEDVAAELLRFARKRNVLQIVAGRPHRSWLPWYAYRSVTRSLVRGSGDFDLTLVNPANEKTQVALKAETRIEGAFSARIAAISIAAVAGATSVSWLLRTLVPLANFSMVYLVAVLLVAVRYGQVAAYFTAGFSFLSLNFLFTEPLFTLYVARREDWLTLVFFIVIATICGRLAARLHGQMEALRKTASRTSNLNEFSRRLAGAVNLDHVALAIVEHVTATLECSAIMLTSRPEERLSTSARTGIGADYQFKELHRAAADWCWEYGQPAGWSSTTLPNSEWLFVPLRASRRTVGVLGINMSERKRPFSAGQRRLLDALTDQASIALERILLSGEIEKSRMITETESLRTALLSSVSHDLRTPLVSVLGSAETLIESDSKLKPTERRELAQTIMDEAERLNRFVQNLLDMTRLGHGGLQLKRQWCDLRELLAQARQRLGRLLEHHPVEVKISPEVPLLSADPVLLQQVFVNLLDNAAKYSPPGSGIAIAADRSGDRIRIRVSDDGPGIPPEHREKVFDMFFRVRAQDQKAAGTGLGLSICRGLIEAHGGTLRAIDPDDGRGACLEVLLPAIEPPPKWKAET